MSTERICPFKAGIVCGPKCGLYSKLDMRCSISLIAEALISFTDLRGRIFSSIVKAQGRVTIPFAVREDLNIEEGSLIRMIIIKEEKK